MADEELQYTIDMSSMAAPYYSTTVSTTGVPSMYSTIGAVGTSGSFLTTNGSNGTSWTTTPYLYNSGTTTNPGLKVTGDSEFEGDVKIQGHSILKLLKSIEDRLAILQEPSPEKLEKYAALKKAYDHYKTLERLIGED